MTPIDELPNDAAALKRVIAEERQDAAALKELIAKERQERQAAIDEAVKQKIDEAVDKAVREAVAAILRRYYGPRSEKFDPRQLLLFGLTVDQTLLDKASVEEESGEELVTRRVRRRDKHGRRPLPEHLERIEIEHDLDDKSCPACGHERCTKRPFLRRVLKIAKLVIVGRLRKDAALYDLPPKLKPGQHRGRGRPRKYGKSKLSLAKRAGQRRGWKTVECMLYGETVTKTYKTFLATYRPVGGVIRVVLVKETHGCYAFFCTDPEQSVIAILEAFADRATIEQDFHDVKEVWGAGQQQVRNIWTNLAVYNLNLWMHTLVELWAWDRSRKQLCNRNDSPWDDAQRRPSHANRRKALRQHILRNELSTITANWRLPRKMIQLAKSLMALAA